jgi:broad specificity phosphatase PhoE
MERLKELGDDYDQNNGIYPPGEIRVWESKGLLKDRIGKVIDKYLNYKKVIVTGHGMAFRTLVGEIVDIPHASIIEFNKMK